MKKRNWIKMGLHMLEFNILIMFILMLGSNVSDNAYIKTENFNFNVSLDMTASARKEKEEEPKPVVKPFITQYTGDLTGYAADCPACNGTLACKPSYNVYKNNVVTYNDKQYGNVRIVASSTKLKCGSIIRFNHKSVSSEPIYAIVLDRGVLGRDIDLLMTSEKEASRVVGRKKTTYDVLRVGW